MLERSGNASSGGGPCTTLLLIFLRQAFSELCQVAQSLVLSAVEFEAEPLGLVCRENWHCGMKAKLCFPCPGVCLLVHPVLAEVLRRTASDMCHIMLLGFHARNNFLCTGVTSWRELPDAVASCCSISPLSGVF